MLGGARVVLIIILAIHRRRGYIEQASANRKLVGTMPGDRVGDVPVPHLSSTGAATIAADLTSGGSSVRPDPEFAKKESATSVDAAAAARSAPRARAEATEQVNAAPFP